MEDLYPVWKVNGKEYCLDLQDLDDTKRYTRACDAMIERERNFDHNASREDQINAYCQMYYEFFDILFGSSAAEQIFNGRKNARLCDETLVDFLNYVEETKTYSDKSSEQTAALLQKYLSK